MLNNNKNIVEIPIQNKPFLNFSESSKYFNIGENKLRELAERDEFSEYVLWNGNRKLIKREQFEKYLLDQNEI